MKKLFSFRYEEMPVMGLFVYDSLQRDYASFEAYSPDFNAGYLVTYKEKLDVVDGIVNPKTIIAVLKKLTSDMYGTIDSLRPIMTRLEGYVERAKDDLVILPKDFGIKEVRAKIGNKDQEGLLERLKIVLQNIAHNKAVLEAKGWTSEQHDVLVVKEVSIKADNAEQNLKMDEKEALVEENIGKLNDFYLLMSDVMKTGKILFKYDNKEKTGDYTWSKLRGRIRHEYKRDED